MMTHSYPGEHKFHLRATYGPGGRKGGKGRTGECEGDLAIQLHFATAEVRKLDEDILRERGDVIVETWEEP